MQEGKTTRIDSLDGLRGIACLSVLLFHVGVMTQPFGPAVDYFLIPGTSSVMVFYVLSGVVLSLIPLRLLATDRTYDWFGYFPRRVVRLCVPLFVAVALGVVAGFAAYQLGSQSRSAIAVDYGSGVDGIIHDILMQFDMLFNVSDGGSTLSGEPLARVDSPVWSMSWELWFSLALPLVVFVVWKARRFGLSMIIVTVLLLLSHFSGYFPLRLCLMFVLGVLVAKQLDSVARFRMNPVVEALAVLACVFLIELPFLMTVDGLAEAACDTLMNLTCMGLVAIATTDGWLRRVLSCGVCRWLGKISYSMYLTHAIVIGGLAVCLPLVGVANPLLVAAIALVLSFGFAWLFWYFVERPSIAWSRSFQSKPEMP